MVLPVHHHLALGHYDRGMSIADRFVEWLPILWFLLVITILLLLWTSGVLGRLLDRVSGFSGFGFSFDFTEKSARETRDSVEQGLGAIRLAIQRKLAADVRAAGLQEALRSVVRATALNTKKGYRCTIHIPDPLYANQLYQLLDYYPKGGGAGRTFSARAGIIGLAWRNLSTEMWHQDTRITEEDLRRQWGMTATEAERRESADRKKVFLAVALFDVKDAVPIGVFYFDAEDPEDLGLPESSDADEGSELDDFLRRIEEQIKSEFKEKMAVRLATLVEAAKKEGPQLVLEGQ